MSNKNKNISAMQVITGGNILFDNPIENIHTALTPISSCGWIETEEGVVLVDTLLTEGYAKKVKEKINGKVKYIVYTHGHMDHVGGAQVFLDSNPEIIASKYLPDRFDRYQFLEPYRARIAAMQFNIPEVKRPIKYAYPTKTFLGEYSFKLGGLTFKLYTERAETDDVVWVHIPELKTVFIGDLIIGNKTPIFPNIGNPWKPTRFALDWAKALERVRACEPENLFYNGGGSFIQGDDAQEALDVSIEVIRSMHDQVVEYINQDIHITEMIHKVKIPDHLKNHRFLDPLYSRPEFFVFNVYRWYHGYFDHNPAHLLPRLEKEIMKETFNLIGSAQKILDRTRELQSKKKFFMALEVLDILLQADPDNIEGLELRMELLHRIGNKDLCLMSRNAWSYFYDKDKKKVRKHKRKNK